MCPLRERAPPCLSRGPSHHAGSAALLEPGGIARDDFLDDGTYLVVELAGHCVRRMDADGNIVATIFPTDNCGTPGSFDGFLNRPTHVVVSPTTGAVYVADTGNNRVIRVDGDGSFATVLGDGTASNAGEGTPARRFPVSGPKQLVLDAFGNLYVAATTAVRQVTPDSALSDGPGEAEGAGRVTTIYGADRASFPESDSFCIDAIAQDAAGVVWAADACQGFLVSLTPE